MNYKEMKALPISAVSQLTGLTLRQIRYYEERELIQPERTAGGTRQYSFCDVERLLFLSSKKKDETNVSTSFPSTRIPLYRHMITGQLNAYFKKPDR